MRGHGAACRTSDPKSDRVSLRAKHPLEVAVESM